MRIVLCDHHVVFAESLAQLLADRGAEVVAVTNDLDQTLAVLADNVVDVCQLDVMFGPETAVDRLGELRRVSPATKVVLLCGRVDEALVVAAQAAASRTSASQSPRFSTCSPGWTPASRRSRRSSWAWRRPVRVERRPTMLSRSRCS